MTLDSGTLTIKATRNTATAGLMPRVEEILVARYHYGERTVGATRFYTALQADQQVDMLVRIPRDYSAKTGDRVYLTPFSCPAPAYPFLIVQIQQVDDEDSGLPATDLSLRAMTEADAIAASIQPEPEEETP